jgi:hypothetical protein
MGPKERLFPLLEVYRAQYVVGHYAVLTAAAASSRHQVVVLEKAPRSFTATIKDEAENVISLHVSPTRTNNRVGGDHYRSSTSILTQSNNHSIEIRHHAVLCGANTFSICTAGENLGEYPAGSYRR